MTLRMRRPRSYRCSVDSRDHTSPRSSAVTCSIEHLPSRRANLVAERQAKGHTGEHHGSELRIRGPTDGLSSFVLDGDPVEPARIQAIDEVLSIARHRIEDTPCEVPCQVPACRDPENSTIARQRDRSEERRVGKEWRSRWSP